MGGIGGIFFRDGRNVSIDELDGMVTSMSHRLKNGQIVFRENGVGLVQLNQRFSSSINTESSISHEHLVVISNSRIDNKTQLVSSLSISDRPINHITDSEFFARAYLKWGRDFASRIIGVFTIAIWDKKKKVLTVVADQIGIRSLYFYSDNKKFLFASEVNAIKPFIDCVENISHRPYYFTYTDRPGEYIHTMIKDVFLLARGKMMTVSKADSTLNTFYDLSDNIYESSEKYTYQEYGEIFQEKFRIAVERRIGEGESIAAELSGGLDSSSICAMASKLIGDSYKLPAYHVRPEGSGKNEIEYSRLVADTFQLDYHEIKAESTFKGLFNCTQTLGLPLEHYHVGIMTSVLEELKLNNISVCLSGEDGDNVISSGRQYPFELLTKGEYVKYFRAVSIEGDWPREYHPGERAQIRSSTIRRIDRDYFCQALNWYYKNCDTEDLKEFCWTLMRKKPITFFLSGLNVMFNSKVIKKNRFTIDKVSYCKWSNLENDIEYHIRQLQSNSLSLCFNQRETMSSMFGVEYRYPFMDRELIEYCISVPSVLKWFGGLTRGLIRVGLKEILPYQIYTRHDKLDYTDHLLESLSTVDRSWLMENSKNGDYSVENFERISKLYNTVLSNPKYVKEKEYIDWVRVIQYLRWKEFQPS